MFQIEKSKDLFVKAQKLIPGGVNSPVRAFKSVGGTPIFIKRGEGPYIFDFDDNKYIDYVLSWGPLVLGHAHPLVINELKKSLSNGTSYGAPTLLETELAELIISVVPSIEMIRFVNSGTEACMSAIRLARAYTNREKIIKFGGNYHGHADMLLVEAGSGVATFGLPDSPGVPESFTQHTLIAPYNNIDVVEQLFESYPDTIAAVIFEPIAANMGFIVPEDGYLKKLIDLCHKHGAISIIDEVMTGFRAAPGGVQQKLNLKPDITCLGKVIGGGLPVGAYAGNIDIMENVAPVGKMYQAGTLSGNPLAMCAGLSTITNLLEGDTFDIMTRKATDLITGIKRIAQDYSVPMQIDSTGSMFGFYFLNEKDAIINDFVSAKKLANTEFYGKFFHKLLESGVYIAPSQFEIGFMSSVHTDENISTTITIIETAIKSIIT